MSVWDVPDWFSWSVAAVSCTIAGWAARTVWGPRRVQVPMKLGALTYQCTRCGRRFPGVSTILSSGMDLTVLAEPDWRCPGCAARREASHALRNFQGGR